MPHLPAPPGGDVLPFERDPFAEPPPPPEPSCQQAPAPFYPEGERRWSLNMCGRAVFGLTVNPDTGRLELQTDSPIRARGNRSHSDRMAVDPSGQLDNQPCLHHNAHFSLNDRGEAEAWFCGGDIGPRVFVSRCRAAVSENGGILFVGHFNNPRWTESIYYSEDRFCRGGQV